MDPSPGNVRQVPKSRVRCFMPFLSKKNKNNRRQLTPKSMPQRVTDALCLFLVLIIRDTVDPIPKKQMEAAQAVWKVIITVLDRY